MLQARDYVNVLLRRWWVIALIGLAAAAAAYGVSKLQTPLFRASTSYNVKTSNTKPGTASGPPLDPQRQERILPHV